MAVQNVNESLLRTLFQVPQLFHIGKIISTFNKCGVFLCTRGELEVELSGNRYKLKRGDVYVYIPSTIVRLVYKNHLADGILVEADVQDVLPIINKVVNAANILGFRERPCFSIENTQFEYLIGLINDYSKKRDDRSQENISPYRKKIVIEVLNSMAQTFIYELLDAYFANTPLQPNPQSKKDLVFQKFMLDLFKDYRKERDVAYYASLQHMSPRYFSSIIKEKSGNNALQWIIQMVIIDAKHLLETSDMSIKEITELLNFSTQSFFGKYFKQYVGVSPKVYRNNKFYLKK